MKRMLITLAMTAGLLALLVGLRGPYARMAAEHLRRQLDSAPDKTAPLLLGQVAELGEPGIPVLVEALGSPREQIARAGKRVLLGQVDRWQMLPARRSSPKLAILADALAEGVAQFGPTARSDAADLVTRILRWPLDPNAVDRTEVIAACETVLRATKFDRQPPVAPGPSRRSVMAIEQADTRLGRPMAVDDPILPGASIAEMARLPGGGLPIDWFGEFDRRPDSVEVPHVADARPQQPRRLPDMPGLRPLGPLQQPDRPLILREDVRAAPGPQGSVARQAYRPNPTPMGPLSLPESREPAEMEVVYLMRALHAEDQHAAARARAELTRRGFSALHVELARRLFDPDPEVRKQLARSLPGMMGVDAVPWLLWLSRDASAEVRLSALTLMATTRDPALLDQVEQMARQDPDPRIQRQAERIARQRKRREY